MKQATKKDLRREIEQLRHVGQMMSNLCYNLQNRTGPLLDSDKRSMKECQVAWDKIERSEINGQVPPRSVDRRSA